MIRAWSRLVAGTDEYVEEVGGFPLALELGPILGVNSGQKGIDVDVERDS